jgi:hypothetical protein
VLQGGNSLVTNPFHHWFASDRYGLDLVKLNALGNRARGISPEGLNDYESYDVAVHSPCSGIVEEALDRVPDNTPGRTDPQHLSGNHVLLRCGALRVLLAHLRRGSVAVIAGEPVRGGQVVGRIGYPAIRAALRERGGRGLNRRRAAFHLHADGRFLSVVTLS